MQDYKYSTMKSFASLPALMTLCFSFAITSSRGIPSTVSLEQYTPDKSNWTTFYSKAVDNNERNTDHSPDGVGWIDREAWKPWDGTTIYDPTKYTKKGLAAEICPGNTVRGIYELFQETKPFLDNVNPSKAEVDNWHAIAINHVRAMVNLTEPEYQVHPDKCLHIRAMWSSERYHTRLWDEKYPDDTCVGSSNPHCGAGFLPSVEDQQPYLPVGIDSCGKKSGSEGLFSAAKSAIPWSIRWMRPLCSTLGSEGFWGGHTGPWFRRSQFGFDWQDSSQDDFNSNALLRAKWSGPIGQSKYENPSITSGKFLIFAEAVTPEPRFKSAECKNKLKWFNRGTIANATECYNAIMADDDCGKRFMTMNPGRDPPGCACYPVDMTKCEINPGIENRLTWDFEAVSSSFDGLTVNATGGLLWDGKRCNDIIWKIKSGDVAHCLQQIIENNYTDCGREFITRNANGGCGCYAPGTTCGKSDTIRESGRKTYKLDVDPAYVIPSTSQSTASPVAPTLAPTELSDVVTDDESCDLVDDKSCKKWVGNKKGKKMKKKCKKNLKKKNKKKKVFVWCPVTCGEKAGLGKCAFMKKKKNKKN